MNAFDLYKENIRVQKYQEAMSSRHKLVDMLAIVTEIYNEYELKYKDNFNNIIFGDFRSKYLYTDDLANARDYDVYFNRDNNLFINSKNIPIGRTSEDSYITELEHNMYFYFDINKAVLKAIMEEIEAQIEQIDKYLTWVLGASRKDLNYQIHNKQKDQDEFDPDLFEYPVFESLKAINPPKNSNMDFIENCIEEKNYKNLAEFLCKNKNKFDYDDLASAVGNISHWLKQNKE